MFATKTLEHDKVILEQGIERGLEKGIEETAIKMLKENIDIALVSKITGISRDKLLALKSKIE